MLSYVNVYIRGSLLFVPNNEHKLRLGKENQFSLLSARIMFDNYKITCLMSALKG